tara:strand:- start:736 stop:1467 length:732 start_codon:yes stop_codon:yes gene_type:complete
LIIEQTNYIKIDLDMIKEIILRNGDNFYCPFSRDTSYLSVFDQDGCSAEFLDLQLCDYSNVHDNNRKGKAYIKTVSRGMAKSGRVSDSKFLSDNIDNFAKETNEANHIKDIYDYISPKIVHHIEDKFGSVCRTRIVKLSAGGKMPWHKDETSSEFKRIVCPIITNEKCINMFDDDSNIVEKHLPADGRCYAFDSGRISHAVFNRSDSDRYALIFTIMNNKSLREHDKYYRLQKWNLNKLPTMM